MRKHPHGKKVAPKMHKRTDKCHILSLRCGLNEESLLRVCAANCGRCAAPKLVDLSGVERQPLALPQAVERDRADGPPHNPQRREADGGGHTSHLTVAFFGQGQAPPGSRAAFATSDRY